MFFLIVFAIKLGGAKRKSLAGVHEIFGKWQKMVRGSYLPGRIMK